ncbi:MAG: PLP-dependent transferase [Selenomonadaceae bacterium]|nr:PLP-dependent transferase [Selenomonadaceae bacterium]
MIWDFYPKYRIFHFGQKKPATIRLSIGTEHIDDIIADLEDGFAAI